MRRFTTLLLSTALCLSCTTTNKNKPAEKITKDTEKIVIYQLVPRIFGNSNLNNKVAGTYAENGSGKLNDVTVEALAAIKDLGATHVWYTGVIQQATKTDWSAYGIPQQNPDVVKGEAGSPYSIADYYAVNAELAVDPARRMEEFEALVKRTHEAGLKVMLDFIPNHVAREYHSVMGFAEDFGAKDDTSVAFKASNNFYYIPDKELDMSGVLENTAYKENPAKVSGNDVFSEKPSVDDWYETVKLNYGVNPEDGSKHFDPIPDTWTKMVDILKYWTAKGVDGFRCDMAFMAPVEFWNYATKTLTEINPELLFVAEIYDPTLYASYVDEGGFDYLYDKVELYDSIRAVVEGKRPASIISSVFKLPTYNTFVKGHMLNFLENHDEQRIASDFFGGSPEAGRPALAVSALCNANPFMIFYGQELGEPSMDEEGFQGADGRTTIFDYWGLARLAEYKAQNYDITKMPEEAQNIHWAVKNILDTAKNSDAALNGDFIDLTDDVKAKYDRDAVFAFVRRSEKETLIVVANFSGEEQSFKLSAGDISSEDVEAIVGAKAYVTIGK